MHVVVVASFTANRNRSTRCAHRGKPSGRSRSPAASCTRCTRTNGTFVFVEQSGADADAIPQHRACVGTLFGEIGEHLDGAPISRCSPRSSPPIPPRASCGPGPADCRAGRFHHGRGPRQAARMR